MTDDDDNGVSDAEMVEAAEVAGGEDDFFDHEPSRQEKMEMRKANKQPSEWLKLLCKDWAHENDDLVEGTDDKFLEYKSYMKGMLSAQLLCRLSISHSKEHDSGESTTPVDFWAILGIEDEFDKSYIVAQVERFCTLYNIRGPALDDVDALLSDNYGSSGDAASTAAAVAAGIVVSPNGSLPHLTGSWSGMEGAAAAAAAAAAVAAAAANADASSKLSKKQAGEVAKAHKMAKDAEKALEAERRSSQKREQRRVSMERKEARIRERENFNFRKNTERAAREATREERRQRKLEMRLQREKFSNEQKDAALKRAAELVASNRVPIEITRGATAAKAAANAAVAAMSSCMLPPPLDLSDKKSRSSIVVSTATDLHQIVTHSKNLWTKYNAIAKEHNQKVNWITVARELGIHVKVREKYARMHARAEYRGFDWERQGYYKIKDYPNIFLEPTQAEQTAKMPLPPPDPTTTVLIDEGKQVDDVMAAAAAVVDAAGVKVHGVCAVETVVQPTEEQTAAAAAVAATLVIDPTVGLVDDDHLSDCV